MNSQRSDAIYQSSPVIDSRRLSGGDLMNIDQDFVNAHSSPRLHMLNNDHSTMFKMEQADPDISNYQSHIDF